MLIIMIYQNDIWGIKSYVMSTPIFERFSQEGLETPRIEIATHYFNNMFDSFWGGNKISQSYGRMAHNFIQEGYDKYGVLSLIAMLGLTFNIVANIVKLICMRKKQSIEYLFISMYVAIMIQINLEPVFDGYPVVVMSLIMIHGLISAYLSNRDEVIRSEVA